ncbi:MAG: hypothetical protein B6D34_00845 [Candidatus Brocadia sp. UTAMX1]|nr:MAG: hypothetical protein B6D34_00845 [Candidatus Brocadia sp. UTAMX1]
MNCEKKLWGGEVIKYVALQIFVRVDKSRFPPPLMGEGKGGGGLGLKNELQHIAEILRGYGK